MCVPQSAFLHVGAGRATYALRKRVRGTEESGSVGDDFSVLFGLTDRCTCFTGSPGDSAGSERAVRTKLRKYFGD